MNDFCKWYLREEHTFFLEVSRDNPNIADGTNDVVVEVNFSEFFFFQAHIRS